MDMSYSPSQCKDMLAVALARAGVARWGVAAAEAIDEAEVARYRRWIEQGCNGEMTYLSRYEDVRADTRLLLEGARSVISCAFPYHYGHTGLAVASYALGRDYHKVVGARLRGVARDMAATYGGLWRVAVDTAPLRERILARQAGVGFIGRNNLLIVPGIGSYVFLGEIITTISIPPDTPCTLTCLDCGACVDACPGGALEADGMFDARRCLSYLTIECRDNTLPPSTRLDGSIYGCDRCQTVCPHNSGVPYSTIPDFLPRHEVMALTPHNVLELTPERYDLITRGSAMRRATLDMLVRNASHASSPDTLNDSNK